MKVLELLDAPVEPAHQEEPQRQTVRDDQAVLREVLLAEIAVKRFQKRADAIEDVGPGLSVPARGVSKDPPARPYYDVAPERTL